jgi:redox-sensitive bicupin YhaK (pirin superfamily)
MKNIAKIYAPPAPHMVGDGFRVHNFIPSFPALSMQRMDPFIMLDYGSKFVFPPSPAPKGVGVHPHRGFETVTIAYKGQVAHHDSFGNSGIINEGDVQWMTAASGLLHKEYHAESFAKTGGEFQMVQLWVNLPAKDKMSAPKYQAITNDQMHKVVLEDGKSYVEVIAGNYKGEKGPANTFTEVHLQNAILEKGVKVDFDFPATQNTFLIVIEGSIKINDGASIPVDHFVEMDKKGTTFTIEAIENAKVLVASGEPIGEPIAAHGPFVMNTRDELVQAFNDFNDGKFGELEDQ